MPSQQGGEQAGLINHCVLQSYRNSAVAWVDVDGGLAVARGVEVTCDGGGCTLQEMRSVAKRAIMVFLHDDEFIVTDPRY